MNKAKSGQVPTTIGSYGLAIQKTLEVNGFDAAGLFARAGLDTVPSNNPLERLTTQQVAALFRECVALTGDPAVGLTVAKYMHPSTLHALGYSLLASSTLRDCCERLVNYFRLASEQAAMHIKEEGELFRLSLQPLAEGIAYETIDAWNAFLVRLLRQLYDPDLKPVSVTLSRPLPEACETRYLEAFHAPVTFDAPFCEICLPRVIMDEPLMGGNREIAQQNDAIIRSYLAEMDQADVITRVKQAIVQSLPAGKCNKSQIARELAMSPSALQQKLAERSTRFQDLLSEVRESLALAYMEQPQLTITEMSFLLGFNDTGSFTRAFRRWTGQTPSDFRRAGGVQS